MMVETLTIMNGCVDDSVTVNVVMGDSPVDSGRGIGDIREANTFWFAQAL